MNTQNLKVNLCCGSYVLPGWVNIDYGCGDIHLDLSREAIPLPDGSVDTLVCMSAINYFTRERALEIVRDVRRVMKPGGLVRFGVQDLESLARRYLEKDSAFYFQKLPDGRDRFPGRTFADKFNEFFYGFSAGPGIHCRYVYDFEALKSLFQEAGFEDVLRRGFQDSADPQLVSLDNRPEQMFFLEARKDAVQAPAPGQDEALLESLRAEAYALAAAGHKNRAWQLLLKLLDLAPADRAGALLAVELSLEEDMPQEAAKILAEWRGAGGDAALDPLLHRVRQQAAAQAADRAAGAIAPARLDGMNARRNRILPDEEHLAGCMAWLAASQDATPDGGSSAQYMMAERRWSVSYPETTGYVAATALAHARLTGDATWVERATAMCDWEIDIQAPDGGVGEPLGHFIKRPRVFNTGQVLLGWTALARQTGDRRYAEAAHRAGEWIVSQQDPDGKWVASTYSGQPKTYKTRVAWALLELHQLTGEPAFRKSAERFLRWALAQAQPNGWFANTSLNEPHKPWTHLVGYTLVGLLECCRFDCDLDKRLALRLLQAAARNLSAVAESPSPRRVSLPATLGPAWDSADAWTCVTGDIQLEFFLRRLNAVAPDQRLLRTADRIMDDIKSLQLLDGTVDKGLRGGLPGAHPVGGPYATYAIPNWGVKFFADSLLQRLLPNIDNLCLG